jgi:kinetochore protein NDC80
MLGDPANLPFDHPHLDDRMLWDFSSRTYLAWFDQGQEDFSAEEQQFEEYYGKSDQHDHRDCKLIYSERLAQSSFDETEALETDLARLTAELKQLQVQEPPLKFLNTEYIHLTGDKTKFIHYLDQIRQKQEKLLQGIERMKLANAESGTSLFSGLC